MADFWWEWERSSGAGLQTEPPLFSLYLSPPSLLFIFIFWGMEPGEPITARYSPLGPSLAPVWHFLIGAWVVIVLCIQHQEERNTAKIFTRPTRRNDTKLDSGAINSSTGSKLWYESEQMFRLLSKKISQTSWRRPIPNDHLKLRISINFKSSKYPDHLKMPCWHGKCPTSWNPGPNFENYFLNFIIRPPSNHVYRSLDSIFVTLWIKIWNPRKIFPFRN